MSWTEIIRHQYRGDGLRYASDLSEEEWQSIAPHLPVAKLLGRPRETDLREAVNAMLYVLTTGCQWRLLPTDFPPFTTVQRFFYGWRDDGTWLETSRSPDPIVRRPCADRGEKRGPAGATDSETMTDQEQLDLNDPNQRGLSALAGEGAGRRNRKDPCASNAPRSGNRPDGTASPGPAGHGSASRFPARPAPAVISNGGGGFVFYQRLRHKAPRKAGRTCRLRRSSEP